MGVAPGAAVLPPVRMAMWGDDFKEFKGFKEVKVFSSTFLRH